MRLLFERLRAAGATPARWPAATVAAIGPGTARALREHGIEPDVVPERSVAESLVEALARRAGRRARWSRAPPRPATCCPTRCASAAPRSTCSPCTRPSPSRSTTTPSPPRAAADYITFTSSSTVRFFLDAAGGPPAAPARGIVSIGPVTSATLREHGLEPDVEAAARHDVDGVDRAPLARATAAMPPLITFLSDYGYERRVRRRRATA